MNFLNGNTIVSADNAQVEANMNVVHNIFASITEPSEGGVWDEVELQVAA